MFKSTVGGSNDPHSLRQGLYYKDRIVCAFKHYMLVIMQPFKFNTLGLGAIQMEMSL